MSRLSQAKKASKWAEQDLVRAREWASSQLDNSGPEAREMARRAKKRKRKAERRFARIICRDYES